MAAKYDGGSGSVADVLETHYDAVFADAIVRTSDILRYIPIESGRGILGWKVRYQGNTSVGSQAEDTTAPTAGHQSFKSATLAWARNQGVMQVYGLAEAMAENEGALIDLVTDEAEGVINDLSDAICTQIWTGTGANDIVGLIQGVDDGSTYATYAGINRLTYTWHQSYRDHNNGTPRPVDIPMFYRMYRIMRKRGARISLVIGDPDQTTAYEQLLTQTVRYNPQGGGGAGEAVGVGGDEVRFKKIPVVDDPAAPDNKLYWLDTRWVKYRELRRFKVKELGATDDSDRFQVNNYSQLQVKDCKKQGVVEDLAPAA